MKKIFAGLIALTISTSTFAWGEREQGAAAALAGVWIYNQLAKPQQQHNHHYHWHPQPHTPPPVVYYPQIQHYQTYRQQICEVAYPTDQFGNVRQVTYCYYR